MPEPSEEEAVSRRRPVVLFVEDEVILGLSVEPVLEAGGFAVVPAASAASADQVVQDLGERVQALFIDLRLSDGVTGFDVARSARRRLPGVPVLFTSAEKPFDYADRRVAGSLFIDKPYDPRAVANILRRMISAQTPAANGGAVNGAWAPRSGR